MGRSNRFVDMNEVYTHTKTARREQPTIHLQHMGRGPNDCRRQPRPQFAVVEGKIKVETRQYKEDQFRALEDRCEASPTQISNLYRHNEKMDPETLLRSAERTEVSTMRKLMPLGGWTGSNSRFQNSQGCYNLQNFGIRRWLLKSFLKSIEWPMHNEFFWWYSHSGE